MKAKQFHALLGLTLSLGACNVAVDDPGRTQGRAFVNDTDADFRDCARSLGIPLYSVEDRYGPGDRALACVDVANCFDLAQQTYEFYPDAPDYFDNAIVTPAYRLDPGRGSDLADLTDCHSDVYGF
ncbi:MAG: hypothetical protein JWN48_1845 [Myxococcaceae bacterium]|nr:hypothetical protein [Myxococcaceae bacterium]